MEDGFFKALAIIGGVLFTLGVCTIIGLLIWAIWQTSITAAIIVVAVVLILAGIVAIVWSNIF